MMHTMHADRPAGHKREIIDEIRERNHTASERFLLRFDEQVLDTYLKRLTNLQGHRGPTTVWTRR